MKMIRQAVALLLFLPLWGVARAEELVTFPSLSTTAPVAVEGHLFRPEGTGRHPAILFLHGCGGLLNRHSQIVAREQDWAGRLTADGYVVLMADSFTPRKIRSMCAPQDYQRDIVAARPGDAFGALLFLQGQDYVQPDRVAVMGWSQGGAAVLDTIRDPSVARPADLAHDFAAAIAFYPARCAPPRAGTSWTSRIPLLVLTGAADVWTVAPPCQAFVDSAIQHGTAAEIHIYPDAYHDFDWPGMKVHEVPAFKTRKGVIPIEGTNEAARNDALTRVPAYLDAHLH